MKNDNKAMVLMVDDQPENLQMLGNILADYKKAVATNGKDAIYIAEKMLPDIILLDIMMPDIDGFEVCCKLKSNDKTKDIPVIFLTAINDSEMLVKGFQLGGVDFITKPFKKSELLIRVQNHIELKKSRDMILKQNLLLNSLLKEKSDIVHLTAHDLKSPVTVIHGFSKMMIDRIDQNTKNNILDYATYIKNSAESMAKIINNFVSLSEYEEGKISINPESLNIVSILKDTAESYKIPAESKQIDIELVFAEKEITIISDSEVLRQVFDNLISNAIKFSEKNKSVSISIDERFYEMDKSRFIRVEIKDQGPGIRPEEMHLLFKKFAKISNKPTADETSSRLGLSIVKNLIEKVNGKVWCDSVFGEGSSFVVELPIKLN